MLHRNYIYYISVTFPFTSRFIDSADAELAPIDHRQSASGFTGDPTCTLPYICGLYRFPLMDDDITIEDIKQAAARWVRENRTRHEHYGQHGETIAVIPSNLDLSMYPAGIRVLLALARNKPCTECWLSGNVCEQT